MRVFRRFWAGIRRTWKAAWFVLRDRELTVLVLGLAFWFVIGVFDRIFKKKGVKW